MTELPCGGRRWRANRASWVTGTTTDLHTHALASLPADAIVNVTALPVRPVRSGCTRLDVCCLTTSHRSSSRYQDPYAFHAPPWSSCSTASTLSSINRVAIPMESGPDTCSEIAVRASAAMGPEASIRTASRLGRRRLVGADLRALDRRYVRQLCRSVRARRVRRISCRRKRPCGGKPDAQVPADALRRHGVVAPEDSNEPHLARIRLCSRTPRWPSPGLKVRPGRQGIESSYSRSGTSLMPRRLRKADRSPAMGRCMGGRRREETAESVGESCRAERPRGRLADVCRCTLCRTKRVLCGAGSPRFVTFRSTGDTSRTDPRPSIRSPSTGARP